MILFQTEAGLCPGTSPNTVPQEAPESAGMGGQEALPAIP